MSVRTRCLAGFLSVLAAACSAPPPVPAAAPPPTPRYSVADFYKNTEFFGASFSSDASRILVSSNTSGIWNAYAIPTGGGEPVALTSSTTDSVFAASYFPADGRILYQSDKGGNELSHV
jgi:Tol biopolymer transport system component